MRTIAITALVVAYFVAGIFTVKFMFDGKRAKFSDKAVTFLLWPVLALTIFCLISVCFCAGIPWEIKREQKSDLGALGNHRLCRRARLNVPITEVYRTRRKCVRRY